MVALTSPMRVFDRRYVLLPVLAMVALITVTYFIAEERRAYVADLSKQILASQERIGQLGELIYACSDAESAQRGFLLTDEEQYLAPFDAAKADAYSMLDSLNATADPNNAVERSELAAIREYLDKKFLEMQVTIDIAKVNAGNRGAISLLNTDVGLEWMRGLRSLVATIQVRERRNIDDDIAFWSQQVTVNRYISAVTSGINLILVILVGVLVSRAIRRRQNYAAELSEEVRLRTQELSELSQHLQTVRESEKASLARELHDELGGLLVAIKMDLAQIARRIDISGKEIGERWQRVQQALVSGIELKRRVIEELRPTLLDNMGLFEALRWHARQACDQAGIALHVRFPVEEPELPEAAAIAVFRVVQESLTNIAKHASARNVIIEALEAGDAYQIVIEDDGVGIKPHLETKKGSHGMAGMKFRMLSIGGTIDITPVAPHGVRTTLTFPRA